MHLSYLNLTLLNMGCHTSKDIANTTIEKPDFAKGQCTEDETFDMDEQKKQI